MTARRCPTHGLALGPEGQCVLCRRQAAGARDRPLVRPGFLLAGLMVLLGAYLSVRYWLPQVLGHVPASAASHQSDQGEVARAAPQGSLPSPTLAAERGRLNATNSSGRSGAYYFPASAGSEPRPLALAFHGMGGSADGMISVLSRYADERRFFLLAVDSGYVEELHAFTWRVGNGAADDTSDLLHARACLSEALERLGSRVTDGGWLAIGHSGGGSSAPYFATRDARFSAYAVLHGGVYPKGLGGHHARGWFSTGLDDTVRPALELRGRVEDLRSSRSADDITLKLFAGGHEMGPQELRAVMDFWLGPGSSRRR